MDRVRDQSFYKRQKELELELSEIEGCLKKCKEEEEVYALLERAAKTSRVIEDLQALESAELLRGADIVGMTTTGAAKNRKLVQLLGCEVVLLEEAGQVSSALLLLALNTSVTHYISAQQNVYMTTIYISYIAHLIDFRAFFSCQVYFSHQFATLLPP